MQGKAALSAKKNEPKPRLRWVRQLIPKLNEQSYYKTAWSLSVSSSPHQQRNINFS